MARKKVQYISEFSEFKELGRMKKKKSPHSLVFLTDDPEGWFIHSIEYATKSGKIAYNEIITEKDMPEWTSWHKTMGWEEN
jgi:hypothetical protein